ncbi:MAG TPA: metallophosphoesterase family protein [Hyphomicrobiaceae bacterium]|nr:metallophosphoesterase family protein [Hyphomicrobiaceae bacterium]
MLRGTERQILVFGGPYSNSRAVLALRSRAQALGIPADRCYCTGDVVAYCSEPEETVGILRDWGCRVIAGNCEEQLATGAADCGCGFAAGTECERLSKGWYAFADQRVSRASRAWMSGLPKTLTFREGGVSFRVIHGGIDAVNRFVFASDHDLIAAELARAEADVVVAGHCGLPFIGKVGSRVWFNPGVIGMPANDGTPDGWYGLIEAEAGRVSLATRRLAYDFEAAARAMFAQGYANDYARALARGLWPSLDILPAAERSAAGNRIEDCSRLIDLRA